MATANPIAPFLAQQGTLILDGGLATELEARGFDLRDKLWSARVLVEKPDAIRQLHFDYLLAGADCIISASYQASLPGLIRRGLNRAQAAQLLRHSVTLARQARDQFWADEAHRDGRLFPLVAASIGPYGAYLADGSEYRGEYGVDQKCLVKFHRPRWQILADSGADLLACETIPSRLELEALIQLLEESPGVWAWFSFSCKDGQHISDGTPFAECVARLKGVARVAAVGVNCTAPRFVSALLALVRNETELPLLVYPNSGEGYDPAMKDWAGPAEDFAGMSPGWQQAGACLIGGCCRTGPADIRHIRQRLLGI